MAKSEPQFETTAFMPLSLNRNTTQNDLNADEARILQNMDMTFFDGRLRRGQGSARTQVTGAAATVQSCFVATQRNCKMFLIDYTNGTIRMTPSDGTVTCSGPLPQWQDAVNSGNYIDEDNGVAGGGNY